MSTDSLKQAVTAPPLPMNTAPRDRTPVMLHFGTCAPKRAYYRSTFEGAPERWGTGPSFAHNIDLTPIGWSPVK